MTLASDKTRHSRRDKVSGVRVQLPVSGKVLNAGTAGIAIEATESLRTGWSYAFRMTVGPTVVSIPGRVAWCKRVGAAETAKSESQPTYRIGVALVGSIWNKRQTHFYP